MSVMSVLGKQRHTAHRIFERLRDEYGFTGGYTIVKDYVRSRRQSTREAFVPLHHPPGHAQVDFGEAVVELRGQREKVAFFCLILPHSNVWFVKAYPRETTEAFPPVDYGDKLPPSPWDNFTPPRRYIISPPLTVCRLTMSQGSPPHCNGSTWSHSRRPALPHSTQRQPSRSNTARRTAAHRRAFRWMWWRLML